ncbi:MAG: hypothetical protein HQM12_15115 [SAR324 cluster bacterium]|nr:hypothetical protein [SAR324 cluster bacterium]
MKSIAVLLLLFSILTSCASDADCERRFAGTCLQEKIDTQPEQPVQDNPRRNVNETILNAKALRYLEQSYRQGSALHDEYGLLRPYQTSTSEHIHAWDALFWNSLSLSAMCLIQASVDLRRLPGTFQLETEIAELWTHFKQNLQTRDGRLYRHPDYQNGVLSTSISRDGIIGFLFLGAVAKDSGCAGVTFDYRYRLILLKEYALNHHDEMGVGQTNAKETKLRDKPLLNMLLKMYHIDPVEDTDVPSADDMQPLLEHAESIYQTDLACQSGDVTLCKNNNIRFYLLHLHFLRNLVFWFDHQHNKIPEHTLDDITEKARLLALVGNRYHYYNWLFITGYRMIHSPRSYRDASYYLQNNFPENLPTNQQGVADHGCAEYIWQKVDYDLSCAPIEDVTYIGTDFLLLFGLIHFYQ